MAKLATKSYLGHMTENSSAVGLPALRVDDLRFHEGDRIRKAREVRGIKQTELALLSRISRNTIYNYEAGSRVKPSNRFLIARALGVSEDWIRTGEGEPTVPFQRRVLKVLPGGADTNPQRAQLTSVA